MCFFFPSPQPNVATLQCLGVASEPDSDFFIIFVGNGNATGQTAPLLLPLGFLYCQCKTNGLNLGSQSGGKAKNWNSSQLPVLQL